MKSGLLLQYVLLALLVIACTLQLVRKLAPGATQRWLRTAASACARRGHVRAARMLEHLRRGGESGGHCGDGCSSCGSCGSGKAEQTQRIAAPAARPRP
ncbi:DUF6587 family protein [Paludibacterium yongneupense]|uniref:DUF6587 family protein n=1 Tax=Paludibacterium yongneupense TaxID=400061 RepID=UPI000419ED9E|nr:DUF6587 family protein [Paludibacterium yongneupense]